MSRIGTGEHPLRVAVVGSGPAGFYVVEHLFKRKDLTVQVDMFERLPVPFGLVRFGVAPDHPKLKSVIRVYERLAARSGFRFYGNVDVGTHLTIDDLRSHYHQVCFATGAQTDRRLGIPGEDLPASHAASEFVAWYNGHPDFRDRVFDLSAERVAVVGVGNVAVDVARILCRTVDELAKTDIADYALEALSESRVREVVMLGRRGPAQAAFTNVEVRELGALEGADIVIRPDEVELDEGSRAFVDGSDDRTLVKKIEILEGFASRRRSDKPRSLEIRFLVSPVEVLGEDRVTGLRLARNRLIAADGGALRAEPTSQTEEVPVDLIFRSVGYRGVPITGLPFDEGRAVVPSDNGRVVTEGEPVTGVYVTGWIKRGPTGVIGTNKPDAGETVGSMLDDLGEGRVLEPGSPDPSDIDEFVRSRQPQMVSYADWVRLDAIERARGEARGRPRVKFTSVEKMLDALGR